MLANFRFKHLYRSEIAINSYLKAGLHMNFFLLTFMAGILVTSLGYSGEETSSKGASSSWHISPTITSSDQELTIAVPYVSGDVNGELTTRIIYELQSLPQLRIDDNASKVLEISIVDENEDKIGYRQDPTKKHKKIIPSENRSQMLVKVTLVDRGTKKAYIGPAYILGSIDYDHQNSSVDNNILAYSMGQLADIDTARDVTYIPLYRDIGNKIAIWLQNSREIALSISQDE